MAYLAMIAFAGSLLAIEGLVVLMLQQIASFVFIVLSYRIWQGNQKVRSSKY